MKKSKRIVALVMSLLATVTVGGCTAVKPNADEENEVIENTSGLIPEETQTTVETQTPETGLPSAPEEETNEEEEHTEEEQTTEEAKPVIPEKKTVTYINVTGSSVNMRSGAGSGYASYGAVDKSTMYAYVGEANGWLRTTFKNKTAYVSAKYCSFVEMTASEDERIEAVISEGTKLLGAPYVYGATRYHDGSGKLLKGFNANEYDCSSLMQYIFARGAGVNLQLTTRTQIYQGKTVNKSDLKRGDLMFFTNASRKNNKGIERVGHVALYLGDNLILHTASDYAKIEQISPTRWSYFIQAQRIF